MLLAPFVLQAQDKPNLTGDFRGSLGPLRQRLHLEMKPDGSLSGSISSLDQGAMGIPCSDFQYDGKTLSFAVPSVRGSWKGSVSSDGATLDGTWSQKNQFSLRFTRDTFESAKKPSQVDGVWLGSVNENGKDLRGQLILKSDASGREYGTFDSIDEHVYELECSNIVLSNDDFSFEIPSVAGRWSGKLSADGNTLSGAWMQSGKSESLVLRRQATVFKPTPPPPITYAPAAPPIDVANLKAVLDEDFAKAEKEGIFAAKSGIGVAIGVVKSEKRTVLSLGSVKADSIFEIGSITKTFTGLILAEMVAEGKVKYDEPVRELLPADTVPKPTGSEITLNDLATQHSGLPRAPDNFHDADPNNHSASPSDVFRHLYADYTAGDLYAFFKKHGLEKTGDPPFLYSNLGFALLGQALANRAGLSYSDLLKQYVTEPLGLKDTVITVPQDRLSRFAQGHDKDHIETLPWALDGMVGAGGIRSTAADLLTYLEAQLHPDKLSNINGANDRMKAALESSHLLRADTDQPGSRIALAWMFAGDSQAYSHGGATGGCSGFALFNPKADYAVVVLANMASGLSESVAQHVVARLEGKPAISLPQ